MNNLHLVKVLCIAFFIVSSSLEAIRDNVSLVREDGTLIQGYLDRPNDEMDFPTLIFIEGSYEASALTNHEKLASRFNPYGIAVLSLEKRGISPYGVDKNEFYAHDCFEERLYDYYILLNHLEQKRIPGCNDACVILGASEGGKIAPRLGLLCPKTVRGMVLIGSGGGLPFAAEMKFQSSQLIRRMGLFSRMRYKLGNVLYPNQLEDHYQKMLNSPESLEMCGPKTWKWWASYLRYDLLSDLLMVQAPIYMIHGTKDDLVPIESADGVKQAFDLAGKFNLDYARYEGLGHALTGREDVYAPFISWVCDKANFGSAFGIGGPYLEIVPE